MTKKGRPSLYDPKYCKEIIVWMARGFSIKSFAGKIGVDESTIYSWIDKHKELNQSIKRGRAKSVLYWEQIGMLGMMGKIPNFNATIWIFNMKNRLGWSDKLSVDIETETEKEDTDEARESNNDTFKRILLKYGRQMAGSLTDEEKMKIFPYFQVKST